MNIKRDEELENKEKKNIAFKSTKTSNEDNVEEEEESDEELAFITRRFKKFLKNQGPSREEKNEEEIMWFAMNATNWSISSKIVLLWKKAYKKDKKVATKATWSNSDSDSDHEETKE